MIQINQINKGGKMNLRTKPTWELRAIIKALSVIPFLNTDEDNERLENCKLVLKERRKK